jgi:hypothetical protein
MNTCKNCNEPVTGKYCSNCGQPAKLKRIDGIYIINEIGDFFFAHKGMLYTVKKMLITPGEGVKRFLNEDRYRFVKPIVFVIITSLIYTLVNYLFNIGAEEYYHQYENLEGTTASLILNSIIIDYPGYSGLIIGFFIAFWIKLFFKKAGYNIYEIFVLICFVSGVTTLFLSIVAIIQGVTCLKLLQVGSIIGTFYTIWAIGQFIDGKKVGSYIKAFISFFLASIVFGIVVGLVGTLIDIFIKN